MKCVKPFGFKPLVPRPALVRINLNKPTEQKKMEQRTYFFFNNACYEPGTLRHRARMVTIVSHPKSSLSFSHSLSFPFFEAEKKFSVLVRLPREGEVCLLISIGGRQASSISDLFLHNTSVWIAYPESCPSSLVLDQVHSAYIFLVTLCFYRA